MMNDSSPVQDVNGQEFDAMVVEGSRRLPVLVDFWATWCQPCLMLAPVLQQLALANAGRLEVVKLDTDREPAIAARYGIHALPTVKLFVNGEIAAGFTGLMPLGRIQAVLDPHLPRASDALRAEAEKLERDGRAAEAAARLRDAIRLDPGNYRLHAPLAALLVDGGELVEADAVLRQLPAPQQLDAAPAAMRARIGFARAAAAGPDPDSARMALASNPADLDARYALAAHEFLAGRHEAAMGELLEIVRRDRKFRDDGGRRALLDAFTVLYNEGPLVKKYRGLLSAALNN
jgi:putative thioredoxin